MFKLMLEKNKKIINFVILNSAALSFYSIISLSSLIVVVSFILEAFSDSFQLSVIKDFFNIIGLTYTGFINLSLERINKLNIFLVISIFISSSSIINRYNKYMDNLYFNENKRGYRSAISSILMFLMLIVILFFLLVLLIYSNYIIDFIFSHIITNSIINNISLNMIKMFLEILLFYILFTLMLIYFPPIKIRYKDIMKESILLTLSIYSILKIFIILFNILYMKLNLMGLLFVFYATSYVIFIIHIVICYYLYLVWKKTDSIIY